MIRLTHVGWLSVLFAGFFLTLKLCHQIDWHWAWVFAPVWIPQAISFLFGRMAAFLDWLANRHETPEERKQRLARERLVAKLDAYRRAIGR